jgi:hypothetical protein
MGFKPSIGVRLPLVLSCTYKCSAPMRAIIRPLGNVICNLPKIKKQSQMTPPFRISFLFLISSLQPRLVQGVNDSIYFRLILIWKYLCMVIH